MNAVPKQAIEFVEWAIHSIFDGDRIDGFDVEEQLRHLGLIVEVEATDANRDEWNDLDDIDLGGKFFQRSPAFLAARKEARKP